jgi:hypothetical protein
MLGITTEYPETVPNPKYNPNPNNTILNIAGYFIIIKLIIVPTDEGCCELL